MFRLKVLYELFVFSNQCRAFINRFDIGSIQKKEISMFIVHNWINIWYHQHNNDAEGIISLNNKEGLYL